MFPLQKLYLFNQKTTISLHNSIHAKPRLCIIREGGGLLRGSYFQSVSNYPYQSYHFLYHITFVCAKEDKKNRRLKCRVVHYASSARFPLVGAAQRRSIPPAAHRALILTLGPHGSHGRRSGEVVGAAKKAICLESPLSIFLGDYDL